MHPAITLLPTDQQFYRPIHPIPSGMFSEVEHYLSAAKGKGIRTRLVNAFANLLQCSDATIAEFACAIECIHNASLLHDDVIDQGLYRRGAPCVHRVWNNKTAILSGDMLLCQGLARIINIKRWDIVSLFQRAVSQLVEGAHLEEYLLLTDSINRYIEVIDLKTVPLFHMACFGVALLCDASHACLEAITEYSKYFGRAFQLLDDRTDYVTPPTSWTAGHDVVEKKITFPALLAFQEIPEKVQAMFCESLNHHIYHTMMQPYAEKTFSAAATYLAQGHEILCRTWNSQDLTDIMQIHQELLNQANCVPETAC